MERYPNLKEEVDSSIPSCEISSLLDKKLARWSTASCALALACWPLVSKSLKIKKKVRWEGGLIKLEALYVSKNHPASRMDGWRWRWMREGLALVVGL